MKMFAVLSILLVAACSSLGLVQKAVEPYSVEASVTVEDAAGNKVVKGVWANSRFIAVDLGQLEADFVIRGPMVYGGPIVELRRFSANSGVGRQVWEIILPMQKGEKTQLVASTWAAARASMAHMPQ